MEKCRKCSNVDRPERVDGSAYGGEAGKYYWRCPKCGNMKPVVVVAFQPRPYKPKRSMK